MTMGPLARAVKRSVDVTASAAGLVVTAPILVGAALAVRATMGAPVFFRQQRPGLDGKPFDLVKLRTMASAPDAAPENDAQRLTPLGSWLRATSIDELPTLWNVLRGDMSLVGPRPLLMEYLPLYSTEQARRHDVRPGMTGLAQVRGRNALSWDDKFAADVEYVDGQSLALDLHILVDTVLLVLRRTGISQEGVATMTRFTGAEAAAA